MLIHIYWCLVQLSCCIIPIAASHVLLNYVVDAKSIPMDHTINVDIL